MGASAAAPATPDANCDDVVERFDLIVRRQLKCLALGIILLHKWNQIPYDSRRHCNQMEGMPWPHRTTIVLSGVRYIFMSVAKLFFLKQSSDLSGDQYVVDRVDHFW